LSGFYSMTVHYVGWGTHFLDYDNDGRMDLTEIGKPLVRPVRLEEVRPFPE